MMTLSDRKRYDIPRYILNDLEPIWIPLLSAFDGDQKAERGKDVDPERKH